MTFQVQLPIFEGPMDLLLFFIQRDEIDIYDIPIFEITEEYIDYIEMLNRLDLSLGGDFLVMASVLMRIKSRLLLPQETNDDGELIEDPRDELVQILLDYKRVKKTADKLRENEKSQKNYFTNLMTPKIEIEIDPEEILQKITLIDLLDVCRQMFENIPEITPHEIERIEITQLEQKDFLIGLFGNRNKFAFSEISEYLDSRLKIIVTFLAILDMIKENLCQIRQNERFGDFMIERTELLIIGESS